jgi:hypothetical protein
MTATCPEAQQRQALAALSHALQHAAEFAGLLDRVSRAHLTDLLAVIAALERATAALEALSAAPMTADHRGRRKPTTGGTRR